MNSEQVWQRPSRFHVLKNVDGLLVCAAFALCLCGLVFIGSATQDDPKFANQQGRQALFVVNLAPREMAGEISEGMLFDIGYADGLTPVLAVPERPVPNGVRAG